MSVTLKPLKRLIDLFAASVNNEELPKSVRVFASQCMILTAHVSRIDTKIDARLGEVVQFVKKLDARLKAADKHIEDLADLVNVLAQRQGIPTAPASSAAPPANRASGTPPVPTAAAPAAPEGGLEEDSDEDPEELQRRMMAEAEAEVAAINNGTADNQPQPRGDA